MFLPRVFITRRIPRKGLDRVQQVARAEVWPDELPPPYEVLLEKFAGVDGLLCLLTDRIDAALMDAAGKSLCFSPPVLWRELSPGEGRTRPTLSRRVQSTQGLPKPLSGDWIACPDRNLCAADDDDSLFYQI